MKRLVVLLFLFTLNLFAQNRKGTFHLTSATDAHELYVAFQPEVHFESRDYSKDLAELLPHFASVIDAYQLEFERGIPMTDEKMEFLALEAKRISGSTVSVNKLKNILKVSVRNSDNDKLLGLAKLLEGFEAVEYCELMSLTPIPPPSDIPPVTANYESNQLYMNPDPGIDMNYAWGLGLSGAGIRVRDVEYGFNANHEDLNDVNVSIAAGMTINASATTAYTEHGTPVFGLIMANKGNYGISGMAYSASEMKLFPEWQQIGYSRVNAVTQAVANSQAGDVILYEMQAFGQGGSSATNYVPAEYSQTIWDLTKAATDAGIIIVEAAANGNQDLDSAFYAPYMARGNSGAILVGGGRANVSHDRIFYSTYGSRVDVQGWSENVFACGYGDLIQVGGDFNQGYTNFSGTSSATPMVAACVIVLQSYYFAQSGSYMTPLQMRQLLQTTGIPQGIGVAGNIGPLPNMQAAIQQVDSNLGLDGFNSLTMSIFPNPTDEMITFRVGGNNVELCYLELRDALGRLVLETSFTSEITMNVGHLPQGIYFAKVTSGKNTTTKKIIKK